MSSVLLYFLIACMVLFWSGNYIAAKIALAAMPPLLLAGLRITIAGIVIVPFYVFQQKSASSRDRWAWRDAPSLFFLGILGVTLNQLFFVLGISYTSVAHAGIIISMTPVCVLLIAAAMRMERIAPLGIIGMFIAVTGATVLQVWRGGGGTAKPSALGDGIVFLGALAFAFFTVFNKRIALIRTGTTVNTFAYVGGALTLLPLTIYQLLHYDLSRANVTTWCAVLYMALFPSVGAYLIFSWALKRTSASQLAAFSYIQPLAAILLGALILHESVGPSIVWAGALILTGVMITERARIVAAR